MTEAMSFGQWLSRLRRAKGITQTELANLAGCSDETIRKVEVGRRRPSRLMAEILAECLEVSDEERPAFLQSARLGP